MGARHLVENHFVDATFCRIRQYVDATYRRIRQFVDYDNPSKFRRKMSKFRRQLNLRTIHTMQLHIRLYSEFYDISDTLLSLSVGSNFRWKGVLKLSIYQPAGSFLRSPCNFLQTGDRFLYFHFLLARDMQIMRSFMYRNVVHCCYSTFTISIFTTPVYFNCRLNAILRSPSISLV